MNVRHFKWGVALLVPLLLAVPLQILNHNNLQTQLREAIPRLTSLPIVPLSASGDIDVNWRRTSGEPLLCLAASKNDVAAAKLLIRAGADLEQRDNNGNTALILAAGRQSQEIQTLLIGAGANIEARNNLRLTALGTLYHSLRQTTQMAEMAAQLRAAGAKTQPSNPFN